MKTKTNLALMSVNIAKANKERHEDSKQRYVAIQETTKLIEVTEQRKTERMKAVREHVEVALQNNAAKINVCEERIQQILEQVSAQDRKMEDITVEHERQIRELKGSLENLKPTPGTAQHTTIMYRSLEDGNYQVNFFGKETENPIYFFGTCKRDMDAAKDHLTDYDIINWIARRLKENAMEWFSIVQDKITTYEELISHFKARYWNSEILEQGSRYWKP